MTIFVFLLPHRDDLVDSDIASLAFMILQLQNAALTLKHSPRRLDAAGANDINFPAD
jgi:hypothetical protein